MKKFLFLGLMIGFIALYSCHSGQSPEQKTHTGVMSNAETTPTTMEGKPVPAEEKPAANSSGIDVTAKSDDQGVGKFKDVKVGKTINAALAAKGKGIFQTSCTACHTATDKRLIGPGLKGVTKIRTPAWIMNQITNPVEMTHKDPISKALLAEYNNVQMTDQHVGDDGARAILEFLRQNDAQ